MKKLIILVSVLFFFIPPCFPVIIDGKFWDWQNIPVFHTVRPRILSRDRAGLDMQKVKLMLARHYLYVYVDGRSVNGQKRDDGEAMKSVSIRVSFNFANSPLQRVRIAAEPKDLWKIKISCPRQASQELGGKKDKYWSRGRSGSRYAFEIKIPVFYTKSGIHVGVPSGPLVGVYSGSTRTYLSDVLINSVDMRTHRLVDTVQFSIKKGVM
jgi:hypothetical protein